MKILRLLPKVTQLIHFSRTEHELPDSSVYFVDSPSMFYVSSMRKLRKEVGRRRRWMERGEVGLSRERLREVVTSTASLSNCLSASGAFSAR